jgi:hypothetical protein
MGKQKETPKEAEKAEAKSYEYQKIDLKSGLNDIAFKNKQAEMIRNLQEDNLKLKQTTGRQRSQSTMPKIQGLQSLKNSLGRQFQKKGVDYI